MGLLSLALKAATGSVLDAVDQMASAPCRRGYEYHEVRQGFGTHREYHEISDGFHRSSEHIEIRQDFFGNEHVDYRFRSR